jgi:hypothetical protein
VVTWTPPALNGGDPLTGYTLTATAGTQTVTDAFKASATTGTIAGLTNGTAYQVSLTAKSSAGTSLATPGSGTPSPAYVPGEPLSLQVAPNSSGALVATWTAPTDNGGDPILNYQVTYQQETLESNGTYKPTGSPQIIEVAGTATKETNSAVGAHDFYDVSVAAVSAAGTGQVSTTPTPITPTTQLAPDAVMLTPATMAALASDVNGTLTWPASAPAQIQSLTSGDTIVGPAAAAAPEGLLAQVASVSESGSGDYTVQTTSANLTDAFTDLSAASSGAPPNLEASEIQPSVPGVRVMAVPRIAGGNAPPELSFQIALKDGSSTIGGQFDLTPQFAFALKINQGFADIPDGVSVAASATLAVQGQVNVTVSGTAKEWVIATLRLPPIPVGPVEVTPTFPLEITASGQVSFGISFTQTIGAGMSWSSQNAGSLNAKNLSTPFTAVAAPLPGVSASASALITIEVPVGLLMYGIGGPDLEADAGMEATVNFNPPTGTPWFEVGPFVQCRVGALFDFSLGPVNIDKDLDVTLARLSFPAIEIGAPPNADLVISPQDPTVKAGATLTLSTTRSDGKTYPVVWTLLGQETGDSISQQGVLRVAKPGGRSLEVMALDSTGAESQTTVEVGKAQYRWLRGHGHLGASDRYGGLSHLLV